MTPQAIIEQSAAEGVRLALSAGGKLKASGDQGAVNRWLPTIREHKPGIVAALQSVEEITIQPDWRELAALTAGLEKDDPRLTLVLGAMQQARRSQDAGDAPGFERAIERTRFVMLFCSGAQVRWNGHEGHALKVLGPAPVEHVHVDAGRLWIWTEWKGQARWVAESAIVSMKGAA